MPTLSALELFTGHKADGITRVLQSAPMSFQAQPGEIWMLAGLNGTGKSTLLHTLCGLKVPASGSVYWDNQAVHTMHPAGRSRVFALVLTHRPVTGLMKALDIVITGLYGRADLTYKQKETRALDWMAATGSTPFAERRFDALSDGEKQRVMLARALAQETPVLLLDEPGAFLDFAAREQFAAYLRDWATRLNKLIFISTHDQHSILPLADNLLFLEKHGEARIIQQPADNPGVQALFQV
jgi:iron complex transport system ATP-binding protein